MLQLTRGQPFRAPRLRAWRALATPLPFLALAVPAPGQQATEIQGQLVDHSSVEQAVAFQEGAHVRGHDFGEHFLGFEEALNDVEVLTVGVEGRFCCVAFVFHVSEKVRAGLADGARIVGFWGGLGGFGSGLLWCGFLGLGSLQNNFR